MPARHGMSSRRTIPRARLSLPFVVFGDAEVGYATVRGSIQRTVDGGAHWERIDTPGTVR